MIVREFIYILCSDRTINLIKTIPVNKKKIWIYVTSWNIARFCRHWNVSDFYKFMKEFQIVGICEKLGDKNGQAFLTSWLYTYIHRVFDLIYFDIHIHMCVNAHVRGLN